MSFTSVNFFIFVVISLILYYIIPLKFRWIVLLAASLAFYCICGIKYLPYIVFTTLSAWGGAIWLESYGKKSSAVLKDNKGSWTKDEKKQFKQKVRTRKRLILALILVLNFGILAFLKYFNFFAAWISSLFNVQPLQIGLLLPIGVSFYTFQTMGYVIDVYWEKTQAQKNPARLGLFTSFFPQIVQGPIAIYDDLAGQLYEGHALRYENIKSGFQLALWGLVKKMVVADRLVMAVNTILPQKNELANGYSLIVLLIYAAQVYLDFSGGIDIARGVAEMFGITMAENFKRPYFSKSVSEFWRRWHVSLGRWMRTYLFYSLALSGPFMKLGTAIEGKDSGKSLPKDSLWGGRTFRSHLGGVLPGCIATLITFLVIGMWHGANWTYAGYGLWNGLIILIAMILNPVFKWISVKLKIRTELLSWKIWQIIRTFVLIMVGFVFDIGDGFVDSLRMIGKCLSPHLSQEIISDSFTISGYTSLDIVIMAVGLIVVLCVSIYQERTGRMVRDGLNKQMVWFQWIVMLAGLALVFFFGQYGPGVVANEFVYMQF